MSSLELKLIPPTKTSLDNEWIAWYEQVENVFGNKKDANYLFVKAWSVRGSDTANTSNLRSFMEKKGVKVSGGIMADYVDGATNMLDSFGSIFKIGTGVSMTIGVIVVLFVILIVWRLSSPQAVGTVIKYAV